MDGKNNGVTSNGVISNQHNGGVRGTAAVAMEVFWEGQGCVQEQSVKPVRHLAPYSEDYSTVLQIKLLDTVLSIVFL